MPDHAVLSREKWMEARKPLLDAEKAHVRAGDELARRRRELPWMRVEKNYTFDTPAGKKTLADLFDGRSQLLVYHLMMGPGWEAACPNCAYLCDHLDGTLPHLAARDVTVTAVSRAPLETIEAFKRRMGWKFSWASSFGSDFSCDFNTPLNGPKAGMILPEPEERPGLSIFFKDSAGQIYQTYFTTDRGLEIMVTTYALLDLMPRGRDEDQYDFTFAWVRHHDDYGPGYKVDPNEGYRHPKIDTSCPACAGKGKS